KRIKRLSDDVSVGPFSPHGLNRRRPELLQIRLAHIPAHDTRRVENAKAITLVVLKRRDELIRPLVIIPGRADHRQVKAALRQIHLVPVDDLKRDAARLARRKDELAASLLERRHHARRQRRAAIGARREIGDARHQERRAAASAAHCSNEGAATSARRALGWASARRILLRPSAANSSSNAQVSKRYVRAVPAPSR